MDYTWFEAGLWGFLGGFALLLGALTGYYIKIPQKIIASIMGFGAGVLIAAACFALIEEAYQLGGFDSTIVGFAMGVLIFTGADIYLAKKGAKHRKTSDKTKISTEYDESGSAIAVGAVLDGIPESVAIGLTIITGGMVSIATVAAVFISNIPEGVSSSVGMKNLGWKKKSIFGLWFIIAVICGLSSLAGYSIFSKFPPDVNAATLALASGALLTMIADTMLPEAFSQTHQYTGLMVALGFILSFILSMG
ncbi:MAG: ZIP family zinc transporter [Methanobacterium sp.]|nr:ZIP family zinc transporter [Methanobacterium sp.]